MSLLQDVEKRYQREIRERDQRAAYNAKKEQEFEDAFDELHHQLNLAGSDVLPDVSPLVVKEKLDTLSRMYAEWKDPDHHGEANYRTSFSEGVGEDATEREVLDSVYRKPVPQGKGE